MHNWKKIPLALIHNILGKNFKFHSNLQLEKKILNRFPKYYQEIINGWSKKLFSIPCLPTSIYSQFLWYNSQILIENESVHFKCFSNKNVNFVKQLFNTDGTFKK